MMINPDPKTSQDIEISQAVSSIVSRVPSDGQERLIMLKTSKDFTSHLQSSLAVSSSSKATTTPELPAPSDDRAYENDYEPTNRSPLRTSWERRPPTETRLSNRGTQLREFL